MSDLIIVNINLALKVFSKKGIKIDFDEDDIDSDSKYSY